MSEGWSGGGGPLAMLGSALAGSGAGRLMFVCSQVCGRNKPLALAWIAMEAAVAVIMGLAAIGTAEAAERIAALWFASPLDLSGWPTYSLASLYGWLGPRGLQMFGLALVTRQQPARAAPGDEPGDEPRDGHFDAAPEGAALDAVPPYRARAMALTIALMLAAAAAAALMFAALLALARPAAAWHFPACAPVDEAHADLQRQQYREVEAGRGLDTVHGRIVELWVNERAGTFSVLSVTPEGLACLSSAGVGWAFLKRPGEPM